MDQHTADQLAALAAISDPLRRALFDFVRASPTPISRDDAASTLGMPRATAAFHLDKLAEEGVLATEFKRLSGKTGPGSGRPSKLYRRAATELSVSIPPRRYELAGNLLAATIEQADQSGEPVREVLARVASETGHEIGAHAGSLSVALESCGYEPQDDGEGGMLLTNCPFHRLAASHTDLICHANLGLLEGVASGADDQEHDVVFAPDAHHCCVRITPRGAATGEARSA